MEKLDAIFYSNEDYTITDDLWTPFDLPADSIDGELDEIYYDADGGELSNLIVTLQGKTWCKRGIDDPIFELHTALINSRDAQLWKDAMDEEMANLERNQTYTLYKKQLGEKAIGCRWVFRKKLNLDGTISKYKARLVAKGYLQQFGKDFNETYAPVAKFKSIRLLLAIAAQRNQIVYHDDATSAFLNGFLKERVLMDQPDGYVMKSEDYKWLLRKTLYGLKQSPREWNEVFHKFMIEEGFTQSKNDPCFYLKKDGDCIILVGLYVDDVLSTVNDSKDIQHFRSKLKSRFKCSEGGVLKWCLGMEVIQGDSFISINQDQYVAQKLIEFDDSRKKCKKSHSSRHRFSKAPNCSH